MKRSRMTEVVMPYGRLDGTLTGHLEKHIRAKFQSGLKSIVLNLTNVDYFNSAGMRILLQSSNQLKKQNGHLKLCCIKPEIFAMMKGAGLDRMFSICQTQEEAVQG